MHQKRTCTLSKNLPTLLARGNCNLTTLRPYPPATGATGPESWRFESENVTLPLAAIPTRLQTVARQTAGEEHSIFRGAPANSQIERVASVRGGLRKRKSRGGRNEERPNESGNRVKVRVVSNSRLEGPEGRGARAKGRRGEGTRAHVDGPRKRRITSRIECCEFADERRRTARGEQQPRSSSARECLRNDVKTHLASGEPFQTRKQKGHPRCTAYFLFD